MPSEVYARVVFQSPLPALDREFEYKVPAELIDGVRVGCRVKVPFAGQSKEGFIVALGSESTFKGSISAISSLVSPVPVLKPHIYELLRAVSARQCCSVGELLDNAVPKRSVRVEKNYVFEDSHSNPKMSGRREAELLRPVALGITGTPSFLTHLANLAFEQWNKNESVIICLPDFRDVSRLEALLTPLLSKSNLIKVDSNEVGSLRYQAFLSQLIERPVVVFGTRSVIYSPVSPGATILVWDDGDESHQDQQTPYLTTREIALMRQSLFGGDIRFLGHSRSTEVQRLVEIGYLTEVGSDSWRPKVAISESRGLDATSFKAIKTGLESGPVLFQVAAPGTARSLYCANCDTRSQCRNCNGPLWLNGKGQIVCRWCGHLNLDFRCVSCGNEKLSQGAAGATRWVEQLGKSFPGIPIREITAEGTAEVIPNKPFIIVATPGIEPIALGGYSAVIFIDCSSQLNRDSLRAPEDALRDWLNALAFMRNGGQAVAVGVSSEVSKALSLGEVRETISNILAEREELGFPPTRRFLSAVGSKSVTEKLANKLVGIEGIRVLGMAEARGTSTEIEYRLLVSFSYSAGSAVSAEVREYLASLTSKQIRTNSKNGRAIRPLTIKFDDPRVI